MQPAPLFKQGPQSFLPFIMNGHRENAPGSGTRQHLDLGLPTLEPWECAHLGHLLQPLTGTGDRVQGLQGECSLSVALVAVPFTPCWGRGIPAPRVGRDEVGRYPGPCCTQAPHSLVLYRERCADSRSYMVCLSTHGLGVLLPALTPPTTCTWGPRQGCWVVDREGGIRTGHTTWTHWWPLSLSNVECGIFHLGLFLHVWGWLVGARDVC